jgi:hypothetical protein
MADKLWSGRGLQIQQSVKCKAFSLYHFVSPGCFPWRKTPGAVPKNKHHSRPLSCVLRGLRLYLSVLFSTPQQSTPVASDAMCGESSRHQLGVLYSSSVLILSTWRKCHISQAEGTVPLPPGATPRPQAV